MKNKIKILLKLFWTFFSIGAFTFGGGYAMIPLIQKEAVEKNKWISDEDILEIIAIAESTPGPIAINAATFVGYRVAGSFGALFSTVGMVIPSFVTIFIIYYVLDRFNDAKVVKYAFEGIRAGVLALIVKAIITVFKKSKKSAFAYALMALTFILTAFFKINVLIVIVGCAAAGLIYSLLISGRAAK